VSRSECDESDGVNYDKLVEEEQDRVVLKPHFRMNPEAPHDPRCEWVARERLFEAPDPGVPPRQREARRFRRLKSSDLVDIFLPARQQVRRCLLHLPNRSL
jgi:hypothetical protein